MNQYNRRFGTPYGMRPSCPCEQDRPMPRTPYSSSPEVENPHALSLAMAYIPSQSFERLYDAPMALQNGTIFEDLNFVFYGTTFVCPQNQRC